MGFNPARTVGGPHADWFYLKKPISDCDCALVDLPSEPIRFGSFTGGGDQAGQSTFTYSQVGVYSDFAGGGKPICFSGHRTGLMCGSVTGYLTPTYDGVTVRSVRTNMTVIGGDSGGPVGYGPKWYGPIGGGSGDCSQGCTNAFFSVFGGSSYVSASGWTPTTQ